MTWVAAAILSCRQGPQSATGERSAERPLLDAWKPALAAAAEVTSEHLARRARSLDSDLLYFGNVEVRDNTGSFGSEYADGRIEGPALAVLSSLGGACWRLGIYGSDKRVELEQCADGTRAGRVLGLHQGSSLPFKCEACVPVLSSTANELHFTGGRLEAAGGNGATAWVELRGTLARARWQTISPRWVERLAPHAFHGLLSGGTVRDTIWRATWEMKHSAKDERLDGHLCSEWLHYRADVVLDLLSLEAPAPPRLTPMSASKQCCTTKPKAYDGDGWVPS